ncbi:MAG: SPOR domain-containing protein, partial [Alphaproteobacteria bacterium]
MNVPKTAPLTAVLFSRKGDASAAGFLLPAPAMRRRLSPWSRGAHALLALPVAVLIATTVGIMSFDFDDERRADAPRRPIDTVIAAKATPPPAAQPAQPPKPVSVSIPAAMPPAKRISRIPPAPAAKGRYRVQLASFGSAAAARREWTRLKSAHGKIFHGLRLTVKSSPSSAFYRLQAGPVASRAAARELCAKLGRPRTGCFLVTR